MEVHLVGSVDVNYTFTVNHEQCAAGIELDSVTTAAVQKMSLRALYRARRLHYSYLQQHPAHIPTPAHAMKEALNSLQAFSYDHLISVTKTAVPYTLEECAQIRGLILGLGRDEDGPTPSPARTEFLSWFLQTVYGWKIGRDHGRFVRRQHDELTKPPPQISPAPSFLSYMSDQKVPGPHNTPALNNASSTQQMIKTSLLALVSLMFFGIPQTYLAHAQKASEFTGRLVGLQSAWQTYTRQLTKEYTDFVIASTVLLSATIGFLSIPDISEVARLFDILSIFASLASIISGIFFVWKHHRQVPSSNTLAYIHNARTNPPGHAVLLSLPPVFLVWSVLTFATSVVLYALSTRIPGAAVATLVVIIAAFVTMSALLSIGLYSLANMWTWKGRSSR